MYLSFLFFIAILSGNVFAYDSSTSFADPMVLKARDGWYYAYATQSRVKGQEENVQCARSKDLQNWERLPDALPEKPEWANHRQNFWAPHVSHFGDRYVMYVSVEQNVGGYCVAAGTANDPKGPFKNFSRIVCGKDFENIDPMAFEDPLSKKKYLYWGSASRPIKAQELSSDGLSFKAGSQRIEVLKNKREPRGTYRDRDGWIYAFGTQMGPEFEKPSNVQAMRSKDSLTWEKLPDAVPARPAWATGNPDHWAPQVVKKNSKFLMYVSFPRGEESCLSVGKAKSPAGPYNEFSILACSKDFHLVNPLLHKKNGTEFLSWEDPSWKNLVRRDLDRSGEKFLTGSSYVSEDLMTSRYRFQRKGYEDLVEGAWVSFHDGLYYLYYSGNECCSSEAHYAVSVARAKSPIGPYKKHGVILKGNSQWLGPGHNSVVTDEKGQDWIVFHAIPSGDRVLHVNDTETEVNRLMLIEKIDYDLRGWPEIEK